MGDRFICHVVVVLDGRSDPSILFVLHHPFFKHSVQNCRYKSCRPLLFCTCKANTLSQTYQLLRFVSWRAFGFWHGINFVTHCLLSAAFVLRVLHIAGRREGEVLRLRSFQVLSFVAPFIWSVFDSLLSCQISH
jgi:hypothetical protein